jgi:hypothetical protein
MKKSTVKYVMLRLGVEHSKPSGNEWQMFSCPLAPARHERGVDYNPSLAIKITPGPSFVKCHSCDFLGVLASLVHECRRLGLVNEEDARLALRKCKRGEKIGTFDADEEVHADPELDPRVYDHLSHYHGYFKRRGFSEREIFEWQLGIAKNSVLLPCVLPDGSIPYVQVRLRREKKFWWLPSGIHRAYCGGTHLLHGNERRIVAVEGIFDAMRIRRGLRHGKLLKEFGVVCLFGASPSEEARDHLFSLVKEELVIATDNDTAGDQCAESLYEEGNRRVAHISRIKFTKGAHDPDEVHSRKIPQLITKRVNLVTQEILDCLSI